MDNNNNNINYDFTYVLIVYLISSILAIGIIFNLLFLSKWGQNFKIKFLKQNNIVYFLSKLITYLSIIWFPVFGIYVFTQLYYYKSKTLF